MTRLVMIQVPGIFPRTTGWSKWEIKLGNETEQDRRFPKIRVIYPPDKNIIALGEQYFGPHARCVVHEDSRQRYYRNALLIDIPTGKKRSLREEFVLALEEMTRFELIQ